MVLGTFVPPVVVTPPAWQLEGGGVMLLGALPAGGDLALPVTSTATWRANAGPLGYARLRMLGPTADQLASAAPGWGLASTALRTGNPASPGDVEQGVGDNLAYLESTLSVGLRGATARFEVAATPAPLTSTVVPAAKGAADLPFAWLAYLGPVTSVLSSVERCVRAYKDPCVVQLPREVGTWGSGVWRASALGPGGRATFGLDFVVTVPRVDAGGQLVAGGSDLVAPGVIATGASPAGYLWLDPDPVELDDGHWAVFTCRIATAYGDLPPRSAPEQEVVVPGGELDRFEATDAVVATRPVLAWLALP